MNDINTIYKHLLNALENPILVADCQHRVIYMNQAAIQHYTGGETLIGKNLLTCHNENSQKIMIEILQAMQNHQLEEQVISQKEHFSVLMCAIRDENQKLLGYFEKFRPKQNRLS